MRSWLVWLSWAGIATWAWSDTLVMKDGTVREGTVVHQDNEKVTLEITHGALKGQVEIPRHEIAEIRRQPLAASSLEAEAATRRAQAEKLQGAEAAAAWVKLGDWYNEQPGYSSRAREAYAQALRCTPEHETAHLRLGHVRTAQGWQAVDEERRQRGLVPLDDVWVRPSERAWLIDRRHEEALEDLRIGPRRDEPFDAKEVENQLKLKHAEEEHLWREQLRLRQGESLLARYGYYLPGDTFRIGASTPYWLDGVGLASGATELFVGTMGSGYYPGDRYYGYGPPCYPGWGAVYSSGGSPYSAFCRSFGYAPGFRAGNFTFGTNFSSGYGGWGGYGCGWPGYGVHLSGGNSNFRYRINWGGCGW